ncbi:hypothetical protein PsorP6_001336 [Peronosclerospora sorghi]|uniref:Uncharacterized protein n=1 Tax=Peronosclerospora sorghi TaxID=230839 RepID=A0ACC0WWM1_9STRA|nr:hypothetical protein PsorP6_001336 [Peronosclerospora sorghi]
MIEAKNCGRIVFVSSVDALEFSVGSGASGGSKIVIRGLRNELLLCNMSVAVYYMGTSSFNLLDDFEPMRSRTMSLKTKERVKAYNDKLFHFYGSQYVCCKISGDEGADTSKWPLAWQRKNTWNGFFLRMLRNGVAPRNNTFLECIILFFVGLYHFLRQAVKEGGILKHQSKLLLVFLSNGCCSYMYPSGEILLKMKPHWL